jgi:hypothetical protein
VSLNNNSNWGLVLIHYAFRNRQPKHQLRNFSTATKTAPQSSRTAGAHLEKTLTKWGTHSTEVLTWCDKQSTSSDSEQGGKDKEKSVLLPPPRALCTDLSSPKGQNPRGLAAAGDAFSSEAPLFGEATAAAAAAGTSSVGPAMAALGWLPRRQDWSAGGGGAGWPWGALRGCCSAFPVFAPTPRCRWPVLVRTSGRVFFGWRRRSKGRQSEAGGIFCGRPILGHVRGRLLDSRWSWNVRINFRWIFCVANGIKHYYSIPSEGFKIVCTSKTVFMGFIKSRKKQKNQSFYTKFNFLNLEKENRKLIGFLNLLIGFFNLLIGVWSVFYLKFKFWMKNDKSINFFSLSRDSTSALTRRRRMLDKQLQARSAQRKCRWGG